MRKLVRPAVHSKFESTVTLVRDQVETAVSARKPPDFPAIWRKFKMEFTCAQNGKCGFCEGPVLGLQYGDVEHFRPKSEVSELDENDPDSWGREEVWKSTVIGRTFKPDPAKPGYWWHAYEWHNYLLSCQICNQQWKGSLFPVASERVLDRASRMTERPLLLSPFDDFEPAEHFAYGRLGEISGLSEEGRATILTCGLDRPSLRLARYRTAKTAHEHLDEIAGNITEREMLQMLRYIEQAGAEPQPYSGMVQTIFRARTGMAWGKLAPLIVALERSASGDRHLCDC